MGLNVLEDGIGIYFSRRTRPGGSNAEGRSERYSAGRSKPEEAWP